MSGSGNSYFRWWVRMTMGPVPDAADEVDTDTPAWLRRTLQVVAVASAAAAIALVLLVAFSLVRYLVGLLF